MTTATIYVPSRTKYWSGLLKTKFEGIKQYLLRNLILITLFFTLMGKVLVWLDPAAGVLDIGILTIAVFGLLVGVATILCSLWLQELLWQPFKYFRNNFQSHFNQLTSWQQCMLYFSSLFLIMYGFLWVMEIVF